MYMGAVTDEAPTPRPPEKRNKRKMGQLVEHAVPRDEMRYKEAIR
jgi:hypothetical protein